MMRCVYVIAAISGQREAVVRRFGVRSFSLFGSVAGDEARPDSER
jgi:predicted nucleotidyltransferase